MWKLRFRALYSILCNFILVLTFICFGCQDQDLVKGEESTDAITFVLYSGDGERIHYPLTRTIEKPIVLVSEDGTDSLALYLSITDTIDLFLPIPQEDTTTTRGIPITHDNLKLNCSGEIGLDAFYQNKAFIKDVILFTDGNAHTPTTRYWPAEKDAKVDFWSYHPKDIDDADNISIVNGTSPVLSLKYSQKGMDNCLIDVTEQKDLFLAYVNQGKEQGTVNLKYHHALSAIRFVAGKALEGTIENIKLTDVCAGGILTYTPNETPKLSWALDDSKSTLDQDLSVKIDENLTGNPSQSITSDVVGTTFLLIPQTIGANTLSVTYNRPGKGSIVYSALMPAGTWEMGKTYTYTLKLMDGLDIEASSGKVEDKVIEGVEITNIDKKTCYVRALVMANWVDEDGNIAALFNPTEVDLKIASSNYERATEWNIYWSYDELTNMYYYKKPLHSTKKTEVKLFNKFTNPITNADGLKLDFVVLVQAVEADAGKVSVKEAWGESIANQLEPIE